MARVELAPSAALTAARAYADALREKYGDDLLDVRLFGSLARGEAHEDSDVDIAVVLTDLDHATYRDLVDLAWMIGLEQFGVLLSPHAFKRATYEKHRRQERPLVMDIEREGLPL